MKKLFIITIAVLFFAGAAHAADFDFSGIVNAPNAIPDTDRGVQKVGERVYRGFCVNNGQIDASILKLNQEREGIHSLVAGLEELEPVVRESIAAYVDEFYALTGDSQAIEREIAGNCR